MVKPLAFKGEKKSKKRKRTESGKNDDNDEVLSKALVITDVASATVEEDDSWVTAEAPNDVTGPVIFALPTTQPSCIACDANGKVFTSEIENIVEGDLATAEPHDVRQVWVANRVAGTEYVSFKGHHGRYTTFEDKVFRYWLIFEPHCRYIGCDKFGILSATREAISAEESFLCIPSPETPGTFNIQTQRDGFLIVNEDTKTPELRGDAETISFTTTFRIRMQARYKPRLKANKESKAREKISRKELEEVVGRRLEDHEVKRLKKARREGDYHETILDVRVKGKHDKFASS
ncbi:hypothetical protein MMC14_005799 [Varicellaria rhodocarpa]|nr:hypothetical protein [Varicellaria rhodocarpa]